MESESETLKMAYLGCTIARSGEMQQNKTKQSKQ